MVNMIREGKGEMLKLSIAYKNGSITKEKLKEICKNNNLECKFDNGDALIFSKFWWNEWNLI